MSDSALTPIAVPVGSWVDVAAAYTAMAGVSAWVSNNGPGHIRVLFTASATQPASGAAIGVSMNPGDVWYGTAAHCWATSLDIASTVAAGLN